MRGGPPLPVESLFGGQIAPQHSVLAGMRMMEARLADEFFSTREQQSQATAAGDVVRERLAEAIGRDRMASVVEDIRAKAASSSDRTPAPPDTAEHVQRIFVS